MVELQTKLQSRSFRPCQFIERPNYIACLSDLPIQLKHVHNVFLTSQLRHHISYPDHNVIIKPVAVIEGLVFHEHPVQMLDQDSVIKHQAYIFNQITLSKSHLLRGYLEKWGRKESQVPIFISNNLACFDKVHKFRWRNSLRGEGCNSPTLNHIYLFNYVMLMIFSYLFMTFKHLGEKKLIWPSLCNSSLSYHKISAKSIVGLDNYGLRS